jgi:hypothetical protein
LRGIFEVHSAAACLSRAFQRGLRSVRTHQYAFTNLEDIIMINNLHEHTVGIAIGVRFRANFSLEDQLGEIVDKILYSKDAYFGPNVFPVVVNNRNEKVLINEDTSDKLLINNSNIILEANLLDSFKGETIETILSKFNSQIIDGILKNYRVTEINRIGIIHRYLFKMEDLAKTFVNKTIGSTIEGINDINVRFTKKIPLPEAMIKKDVNDYLNVIFNVIKRADQNELFVSVDYQKLFDPFLTSSSQIDFEDFTDLALSFNSKSFLGWFNENYGVLK